MPIYILHGGETKVQNESNFIFFKEMAERTPKDGTCLLAYFSCLPETWHHKFQQATKKLNKVRPTNTVMATIENFEEEVRQADVIYFHGGETQRLLGVMKNINLSLLTLDKVYIGSSAGVNMLCERGYSGFSQEHMIGLGVLPFNVLVHSDNPDFDKGTKELLKYCSVEKPLLRIPETEYMTLEF